MEDTQVDQIGSFNPQREGKLQMMERILNERSLNTFQAQALGDSCLNTTVSILRTRGVKVLDEWEKVPNRFGTMSRVKRYWIEEESVSKEH